MILKVELLILIEYLSIYEHFLLYNLNTNALHLLEILYYKLLK